MITPSQAIKTARVLGDHPIERGKIIRYVLDYYGLKEDTRSIYQKIIFKLFPFSRCRESRSPYEIKVPKNCWGNSTHEACKKLVRDLNWLREFRYPGKDSEIYYEATDTLYIDCFKILSKSDSGFFDVV
jgi:hypothetical protein